MTSLAIVTEGGSRTGLGHLRRCLTLAGALMQKGMTPSFHVSGGEIAETLVTDAGFAVVPYGDIGDAREIATLGEDAILIDSYRATEEVFLACGPKPVIAIDDVADRRLRVAMIVNSTIEAEELSYDTGARLLLGPRYALLRPEFRAVPERTIREEIETVLITLGGGDQSAMAKEVVGWCRDVLPHARVEVVIGPFSKAASDLDAVLLENPPMREVMLRADLAVSAGGQTLFELAATGTPAIVITTAENQVRHARGFANRGSVILADRESGRAAFDRVREAASRAEMSRRGRELVDGRGAERTASAIVELLKGAG